MAVHARSSRFTQPEPRGGVGGGGTKQRQGFGTASAERTESVAQPAGAVFVQHAPPAPGEKAAAAQGGSVAESFRELGLSPSI